MMKDVFILLIYIGMVFAFEPTVTSGDGWTSASHYDISSYSIQMSVGRFLLENDFMENISTNIHQRLIVYHFFGNDTDGLEKFHNSFEDILNDLSKQSLVKDAYVHCNAEELIEAHHHIISLRKRMSDIVKTGNPDLPLLREYIGKTLYTLQNFYSSTNWVEMGINQTYRDFGVPGKILMPIADNNVHTCLDCDNSGSDVNSCKNNLLVTNTLTSGYHGNQIPLNPYRDKSSTSNKCGFGGSTDVGNGDRTATGGINKATTNPAYSPHHYLHRDATRAAKKASIDFIIDPDIGIINDLTNEVFAKIFNLYKRYKASFGFAIDVTGSMGDNIAYVKTECARIVSDVRGTVNEPTNYVLTTFSDPESLTTLALKTEDGLLMTSTIDGLEVNGGHDCPEYSMDGLNKCIEECQEHSNIFVFTDADAKDEDREDEVLTAAKAKDITVDFILTGSCSRRKRSSDRTKRQSEISVYDAIAQGTGGYVYRITSSEISTVMQQITEERFPSATAIINAFSLAVKDSNMTKFPVDMYIKKLKVEIVGPSDVSEVDVIQVDSGSILTKDTARILFDSPNKVIVTLLAPAPGEYLIERKEPAHWDVNITAQTDIDFDYYILEKGENDFWYRITGNPIIGENYTLELTVYNLPTNDSISDVILMDNSGAEKKLNLTNLQGLQTKVFTRTILYEHMYEVSIRGIDEDGNEFLRTSAKKIYPTTVKIQISALSDIFTGTRSPISYTISNHGITNGTFVVTVTDNHGFSTGTTSLTQVIPAGETITEEFFLVGSASHKTVTYTIDVQNQDTTKVFQQVTKSIFVSTDIPPTCTIAYVTGNCSQSFYDDTCSRVNWFGLAVVTFKAELMTLKGTNGLSLSFDSLLTSPLSVNVSGDCCGTSAYLTVIDKNSHMIKCYFNLGQPVYLSESEPVLPESVKIAVGVIAGITVLCIAVSINLAILVYRQGIRPKLEANKVSVMNIKAVKDLPDRNEHSSKKRFHEDFSSLKNDFCNTPPFDTSLPFEPKTNLFNLDAEILREEDGKC